MSHSDLMRIKGVDREYAKLLEAAGAHTVHELAARSATNLSARVSQVNQEKNFVRLVPAASRVADWVQQARRLDQAITH